MWKLSSQLIRKWDVKSLSIRICVVHMIEACMAPLLYIYMAMLQVGLNQYIYFQWWWSILDPFIQFELMARWMLPLIDPLSLLISNDLC
jgi:hypothetical protein